MKNIAVRLEENNAEQLERVEIILRASGYKQQFEAWDVMMKGRGFNMVYAYSFGAFAVHNHLEPIDGFEVMEYQDFVNEYGKDEPKNKKTVKLSAFLDEAYDGLGAALGLMFQDEIEKAASDYYYEIETTVDEERAVAERGFIAGAKFALKKLNDYEIKN